MTTPAEVLAPGAATAVLVVDVQHDFMEGGALAVGGASYDAGGGGSSSYEKAVGDFLAVLRSNRPGMLRCWSQDFHPAGHASFASEHAGASPFEQKELEREVGGKPVKYTQTLWPDHCVQGTRGADFVHVPRAPQMIGAGGAVGGGGGAAAKSSHEFIVQKGCRVLFDSYSPFEDDGGEKTGLGDFLRQRGIKNVVCFGLATDFCVHAAATDGVKEGFRMFCVKDLCRAIDPAYDWANYEKAGVTLWSLQDATQACEPSPHTICGCC